MKATCTKFTKLRRNTLMGFADVAIIDWGMTLRDVAIHTKNGSTWAAPAARPQISKDGTVIKDATTGKVAYVPIVEFSSRAVRDAFSAAVIAAVQAHDATALDEAVP
jgi:hypothetical protein